MKNLGDTSTSTDIDASERLAATGPNLSADQPKLDPASHLLLAVTRDFNAASNLTSGLRRVADRLKDFIDYDTLGILLVDDLGRELRFELALGFDTDVAKHWRFGMGQGIVGIVAKTREPLMVGDVTRDSRYINASNQVRSELAVPLSVHGRTVGVLDLGSFVANFYTKSHERLLVLVADHLATAIDHARLHENLRRQAQNLALLHEVGRELSSILDRNKLLQRVAYLIKPLIDYDLFSVMLWNSETQELESSIAVYRDGLQAGKIFGIKLGTGICGTAAALRQPVRVSNVAIDPRYVPCVQDLEVRSELTVPLVFEDRLLGVLDLESEQYDAFTSQHEQVLATLASSLAVALENARLYENLRQDEARLQEDLDAAREIQKQLLPKQTPWLPGVQLGVAYEPARHLGGDFYDFHSYGNDKLALAVGDVSGKSTSAALYGSLALGMLRETYAQDDLEPRLILKDMNRNLWHLHIGNRFLALTTAVFNNRDRTLVLSNSGLPRPYLMRQGTVEEVPAVGMPLGIFADRSYEEVRLQLNVGDAVVICSDGIEESVSPQDEEFGRQRIKATLARLADKTAPEIAGGLQEAAAKHAGPAGPSDDCTILTLKIAS